MKFELIEILNQSANSDEFSKLASPKSQLETPNVRHSNTLKEGGEVEHEEENKTLQLDFQDE